MRETPADIIRLEDLLDRSYESAGPHLREVITPERRLSAQGLVDRLQGMRLLVLATVTADGRPISAPVDGFFYRAAWYFGSSDASLRFRHIRRRRQVSATHLPGEAFSVITHGRATEIDLGAPEQAGFRQTLLDAYVPRYGPEWERLLDAGVAYARIDAERMFTFHLDPA